MFVDRCLRPSLKDLHGVQFFFCVDEKMCNICRAILLEKQKYDANFSPRNILQPLAANGYKMYAPVLLEELEKLPKEDATSEEPPTGAPDELDIITDSIKHGWDKYATFLECMDANHKQKQIVALRGLRFNIKTKSS